MGYKDQYKKAKEEKTLENVSPEFMKFTEKGAQIVGKFIASFPVKSTRGEGYYNQYLFETDLGLVKFALGSATDKEISNIVFVGGVYAITYEGKEELTGGHTVNKFKVEQVAAPPVKSITGNLEDVPF